MTSDTLSFVNEVIRPLADLVAGIMDKPKAVLDTFASKGFAADCGFADSLVTQDAPLELADYGAITPEVIPTNDSRTPFSNIELLAFLRIVRFLGAALDADPAAKLLIRKIAVNPRLV